ncbi:MAG: tyrosine-protein phosphatase [Candidatus Omnitrophica bacterium]|nr:tyrosine-protein phosphatase [Candidatus Omnitrophota bacterium]
MIKRLMTLFFLAFFISGCVYLSYLKDPFYDIPNFSRVTEGIYRGGYPKPQGYQRLKELGIKTIVNLSAENKRSADEKKAAADYGFEFVQIPLSVYVWPEDEKVLLFLKTVTDRSLQPVFVHCTRGRDLTGAMIAVYRVIVEKKGPKEGYREAVEHGFWPYRGETVLKDYIHQLKDRKVLYEFVERNKTSG